MSSNKYISIREYARQRGCDEKTVREAIQRGYIERAITTPPGKKHPKLDPEIADREWAEHFDPSRARNAQLAAKLVPSAAPAASPTPPPADAPAGSIPGGSSLQKAKLKSEIHKAQLLELKCKQQAGELVKKADVYRELYAYGNEIRRKLEAIPDRVADEVLAADSRHQVRMIIAGEIEAVLNRVSDITAEGSHE